MAAIVGSRLFQSALWGGSITAILCAIVGYFMVLRALAFASEALTDVGFAGIMGSALIGANPLLGMLGMSLLAVVVMGSLQDRMRSRDVEVGMVLSFALGLGVLFLSLFARTSGAHANARIGLFFGSLLHLPPSLFVPLSIVAAIVLCTLAVIFRPLLFASIDPVTAKAKGVPTKALDFVCLLLLGATTAIAILSMGVLLAFALISAPAGAAVKIAKRPGRALLTAIIIGLGITWAGILLAFFGPWKQIPIGVYIASLCGIIYGVALVADHLNRGSRRREDMHHHERETRG